jgi:putative ABC transport system permease protein
MPEVADWRERSRSFERVSVFDATSLNYSRGGEVEQIPAEVVSPSFFPMLGAVAARGRTFRPDEDQVPDRDAVVVVSDDFWRTRLAADPAVVGRTVMLNDRAFTIVGIMPRGFTGLSFGADVWIPSMMQSVTMAPGVLVERGSRWLGAIGQLRRGVPMAEAQRDVDAVAAALAVEYPRTNAERGVLLMSLRQNYLGDTEQLLVVIFVAVLLFLLLSCANVTGLQLVRATGRRREVALRFALGAGQGRMVRQLLTESLVLSLAGGVAGVLVATWGMSALVPLIPDGLLPPYATPRIDVRVLAFGLALTTVCGVAFGLVPALRASRTDLSDALRDGARSAAGGLGRIRRVGLQQSLVIGELAIALVLLIGAGLMVRTFQRELSVEPGFRADGVLAARLRLPSGSYDAEGRQRFVHELLPRLREMPGVASVSLSSDLPFSNNTSAAILVAPGSEEPTELRYYRHFVSSDFFATLGIPIVRGRAIGEQDRDGAPGVAVISQPMATRLWPNADPIGQRFHLGTVEGPEVTVVGVAAPARFRDLRTDLSGRVEPDVYFSILQIQPRNMEIAVRMRSGARLGEPELRAALAEVDPSLPLFGVNPLVDDMRQLTASSRFGSVMLVLFGVVALVLAGIGIYGVIAFVVGLSRREIAVRMALGADARGVVGLVMRNGLVLAALGLALGLVLSAMSTRALATQLFGVAPLDPFTFAMMALVLLTIAATAIWIPARRATRVDPQTALKSE